MQTIKVALVGRPNVGKSTLFNCLSGQQTALTSEIPGLTRDEEQATFQIGDQVITVCDLGGIDPFQKQLKSQPILSALTERAWRVAKSSTLILWVVDFKMGLTQADQSIAQSLRRMGANVLLVINKCDHVWNDPSLVADFFRLGFPVVQISAAHRLGMEQLKLQIVKRLSDLAQPEKSNLAATPLQETDLLNETKVNIAIIGRPNVGKSSLINACLGYDRMIVSEEAGTTRQPIRSVWDNHRCDYTLIDTAGLRQRNRISEKLEKVSALKTVDSIGAAQVVWLVWDLQQAATQQDLQLLRLVLSKGKSVIVVLNKVDQITNPLSRKEILESIAHKLRFAAFVPLVCISAKRKVGLGRLKQVSAMLLQKSQQQYSTARLNKVLASAREQLPEPMLGSRRMRLKFICQNGRNPILFSIYGNQTDKIPEHYERYLMNYFRAALQLDCVPLKLNFIQSENPFIEG